MKSIRQLGKSAWILSIFCVASFASSLSYGRAATDQIAVVSMQEALIAVGKDAKAQLEREFNAKKAEFQKEETAIKKMSEDFQKQSLVMNDEARSKKQSEIQKRILAFQQATQQSQEEIQAKERKLTQPIIEGLRKTIAEIAKPKGYNPVLEKNENLILYFDGPDITSEVIAAYSKGKK